jgi:glycosyltransferase involved in cell wall biosynthesis
MRILLLATDAFGGHGGIALFNREFSEALAAYPDCEQVVVLPRVISREIVSGTIPAKVRFVAATARGRARYLLAARAMRNERFDLVFCGHVNLLPIARLVSRDLVLITHGIEAWKPLRDPLSRRLVHRLRGVISVSDVTRSRFIATSGYTGRAVVLPNAVRAENYGIKPRDPALAARYGIAGKRVLLTVGRVVSAERYKGFDEVMEVLPDLPPDVVYLIAGGGDDLLRLRAKAAALGLAGRVIFTGLFPDSEKAALYNLADVYVMPSRGEGFGFVLLEAMASGIPTIASRHDGGREAVRDGKLGVLVDPASPADIRAAITEALEKGEKKVPEGLDYFSFDNFRRRVHAILDELRG